MISRMQLPREMYMGGGISSLSYPSYGYADGGITTLPNYMGGGYIDFFRTPIFFGYTMALY